MDNVKYNIGDKISNFDNYVSSCVTFEYLNTHLKIDDKIITYTNIGEGNVIVEYKFTGWKHCSLKASCGCKQCKGYIGVLDHKNNELSLCMGSSNYSDKSLILKIIKNNDIPFLEDLLFEL